jgi:hypothetical protein
MAYYYPLLDVHCSPVGYATRGVLANIPILKASLGQLRQHNFLQLHADLCCTFLCSIFIIIIPYLFMIYFMMQSEAQTIQCQTAC